MAGIDVQIEQVMDGARVLGTVQALKRARAGTGRRGRRRVHVRFEGADQRLVHGSFRPRRKRRRHQTGPQLPDHLLGDFGMAPGTRHVKGGQRQSARPGRVVVARDAVAPHHCGVILG